MNTSYFNYGSTLYAVADGVVVHVQDGLPENSGDAQDVKFKSTMELAGNFLVLDIGGGRYAYYCHCIPQSFLVRVGDRVKEGDPVALLGNSGNSTAPHLHFQITDGPAFFSSNGIPFVIKEYTKTGEVDESGLPRYSAAITGNQLHDGEFYRLSCGIEDPKGEFEKCGYRLSKMFRSPPRTFTARFLNSDRIVMACREFWITGDDHPIEGRRNS